jgi:hypothetical protein
MKASFIDSSATASTGIRIGLTADENQQAFLENLRYGSAALLSC